MLTTAAFLNEFATGQLQVTCHSRTDLSLLLSTPGTLPLSLLFSPPEMPLPIFKCPNPAILKSKFEYHFSNDAVGSNLAFFLNS